MKQEKLGIALGGGGARGWAHIGVLKALDKIGIKPDIIAGTSIGAIAGGCYSAGELNKLEEFACNLTGRKVLGFLDLNIAGSSLITGKRICSELETHLEGIQIEQLNTQFVAVATEIGVGNEIWLDKGDLVKAMQASYALPGIFRPVNIQGRWLFDGAIVNPIPVNVCRALGATTVIAVNLNADSSCKSTVFVAGETKISDQSSKKDNSLTKNGSVQSHETNSEQPQSNQISISALRHQIFGSPKDPTPGISQVMLEAFNITQDRISRARLAGDPPDITVKPRLSDIGLFDFHKAEEMIEIGVSATERMLADIAHFHGNLSLDKTTQQVASV